MAFFACIIVAMAGSSLHNRLVLEDQRVTWLQREQPVLDMAEWRNRAAEPMEWSAFEMLLAQKRREISMNVDASATIENAVENPGAPGSVFEIVEPALPLEPPVVKISPMLNNTYGAKQIGDLKQKDHPRCRVYVLGSAADIQPNFVIPMRPDLPCEVHVFDCVQRILTEGMSTKLMDAGEVVTHHPWCIGHESEESFIGRIFTWLLGWGTDGLNFKSLSNTMVDLGHLHVDFLKVDSRGLEWKFLQTEIYKNSRRLPAQLGFKLHTEKTVDDKVPRSRVIGNGFAQVNQLFQGLDGVGYQTIHKNLVDGDPNCADFMVINFNERAVSSELRGFWRLEQKPHRVHSHR
jgi:hypothetical protein